MIRKAYIVEMIGNQAKVRIPYMHGMPESHPHTSDDLLPIATISGSKAIKQSYAVGDIVYVAFEGDDIARPVIIGHLELPDTTQAGEELSVETTTHGLFENLTVNGITRLAGSTYIGKVSPTEIGTLDGVRSNIQNQFDNITNTTADYITTYYTKEYSQLERWRIDARGIMLDVRLLDADLKEVDTIDYVKSITPQNSILSNAQSFTHTNADGTTEDWLYTEGYNVDARQRLNWMGTFGVRNDVVKYQAGLFSRNWWDIDGVSDETQVHSTDTQKYVKSEYTYRPAIQSYVDKNRGLSNVSPIENKANEQQNYTDDYLPYNLLINPEGGDTHIGRGNNGVVIYDNDGVRGNNLPRSGLRLTAKSYQNSSGETVPGGDILIQVKDGQLYQTDLQTMRETRVGSGAGGGATYFTVSSGDEKYVNAYIQFNTNELYVANGLYSTSNEEEDQLLSGNLTFRATIAVVLTQTTSSFWGSATYQDILPVSAQASLQLGSLKEYFEQCLQDASPYTGVVVDLTTSLGVGWDNMYFHFLFRLTPTTVSSGTTTESTSFDYENDIIQLRAQNIGNYITEMRLSDNVINFNRATLTSTVFYNKNDGKIYTVNPYDPAHSTDYVDYELEGYDYVNGAPSETATTGIFSLGNYTYTLSNTSYTFDGTTVNVLTAQIPATVNLSIEYGGVGVEGVTMSTIEVYDQNSIGGSDE